MPIKNLLEEVKIHRMKKEDIPEASEIERLSFPNPWSSNLFSAELEKKDFAFYWVMEYQRRLVAYAGYWKLGNEAHLVTLAVHPSFRRKGLGSQLLKYLLEEMKQQNLDKITLEVRYSNLTAQRFYQKFGFKKIAIRPNYYADINEDAIVYWKILHPHLHHKPVSEQ